MTSRTPMGGVQPRPPPQRTLSGSGVSVQRPSHQRTVSQQYLPPSPARKDNVIDLTGDANDAAVAQNRYTTMPRRGGSRLKLELSNDSNITQQTFIESPQTLTPSRSALKSENSRFADTSSPASVKGQLGDSDNPPMPMPPRRPRFTLPTVQKDPLPTTIATKKDGRPKPYTLEVPTAAPRYAPFSKSKEPTPRTEYGRPIAKDIPDIGYADFFPWNGNHAEDHFSETVIKHGFYDKAPTQQAETTSAKLALFPALKHKSGLNLLSNIFVGVLNQRKHNGQITAPSTFKPPPRVTLTDTKREIWLRDLANPSISLRRLSRTIPHGIRGKVLLDHCLNKNVPTERAVWLVKCVGANEIRSFKRKGVNGTFVMGGEAKWLRDWTIFVEQFVEGVSSAFGDDDWKVKVQYAIRLATHLYSEHLLERDHYMDWLVAGLENSSQAKLPMWILITQIYWRDLLRLRKYGRRLINALLNHLTMIHNDPDRDILIQLSTQLSSLLTFLISAYPDNFLSPTTWFRYRDALLASLPMDNESAQSAYAGINARNERLVASSNNSQPEKRQILVKALDRVLQSPFNTELASQCWSVGGDKNMIAKTVLEWCTSPYRPGQARVYAAAGLFREWAGHGLDITGTVLDFLDKSAPEAKSSKVLFHQFMSEIVRSGHFNPQQYVLWLIAQGGLKSSEDSDPDGPCATRLLVELPLHALSASFKDIRSSLLRRAAYDVNDETADIAAALKCVRKAMGVSLDPEDESLSKKPISVGKLTKLIKSSSRALQTEVGARLLDIFNGVCETKNGFQTSSLMFSTVRSIFESASDYSMLAEMLKSTARSSSADILASCADTLNVHLPIFAALGVAKDLCNLLFERLKAISEESQIAPRSLLASLASLTARIPELTALASRLRKEILHLDRSAPIDVCSPVSDNMTAQLQDAEGELHEEIEKLLATGNSVDRPTMDRLFQTVVSRLEKCWSKSMPSQRAYSALLARLRVFDPQHFDVRMTDWVHHVSMLPQRPALPEVYPLLISLGCLNIPILLTTTSVDAVKFAANLFREGHPASTYMQEVLRLILMPLPSRVAMTQEEAYRFYIEPQSVLTRHQKELAVLVRNALIEYSRLKALGSDNIPLDSQAFQERVLDLLRLLVLNDPASVVQIMSTKIPDSPIAEVMSSITSRLLMPDDASEAPMTFEEILELANELTLPFCQLKLSAGLVIDSNANSDGEDQTTSQFAMFTKAMDRAIEARNLMWTSMLPYLSDEVTEHLKSQAQNRFFSLLPSVKNPPLVDPLLSESVGVAENLLAVVAAITRGRPPPRATQLNPAIVERLSELWELMADGTEDKSDLREAILAQWLPALLKLVTLHVTANDQAVPSAAGASMKPPANAAANEIRSRLLIVLSGILLELDIVPPAPTTPTRALASQVLDLALLLADNLPEEARLQCVRVLLLGGSPTNPVTSDSRLRYLLSYMPVPTEQFMLAHRQPSATPSQRTKIPISVTGSDKLTPFVFRRWEMLSEPTPNVGENDTSLSLTLFEAIKIQ